MHVLQLQVASQVSQDLHLVIMSSELYSINFLVHQHVTSFSIDVIMP